MIRLLAPLSFVIGLAAFVPEIATREQVRLRSHFDAVLLELRARDASGLSADQVASRKRLIDWLGDYRDAGRFPLNDGYSASATPIFRDRRGSLCAMAYLIARSGREDIVDSVASSRNLAFVRELADLPSLTAWLDSVGLTVEEAGRVQPSYPPEPDELMSKTVARSALYLGGAAVATTVWSLTSRSWKVGTLGVLSGLAALAEGGGLGSARALGTRDVRDNQVDRALRVAGATALLTGAWAILTPNRVKTKTRQTVTPFFAPSFTRSTGTIGVHVRVPSF